MWYALESFELAGPSEEAKHKAVYSINTGIRMYTDQRLECTMSFKI